MQIPPIPIRVITHNIRYAPAPSNREPNEPSWRTRLPRNAAQLRFHTFSAPHAIICCQELLYCQLVDLLAALNVQSSTITTIPRHFPLPQSTPHHKERWTYVGVGRDDGRKRGEFCPIFYQPEHWTLERWRTVWLSETPEEPSKGWDAGCARLVTQCHFRKRGGSTRLVVMCTHLDNAGTVARRESAKIIRRLIDGCSQQGLPVVLAGDLNSDEEGEAYRILSQQNDGSSSSVPRDARNEVDQVDRYGDNATFTGFAGDLKDAQRIDYVFVTAGNTEGEGKDQGDMRFRVVNYAVLPNKSEDGIFDSDHRAVVVDLELTC